MRGYGQFCPMARAAEVLCERWTLLVVRELLLGAERFNDIRRGIPLISPTVLSARLASLQQAGVVAPAEEGGYRLTEAGWALESIVMNLAHWGDRWLRDELREDQLEPGGLLWSVRCNLRPEAMPAGSHVVEIQLTDAPKGKRRWWLVVDRGEVDLCLTDPGFEPDLWLSSDLRTLAEVWTGARDLRRALAREDIAACGDRALQRTLPQWLPGGTFAQMKREASSSTSA